MDKKSVENKTGNRNFPGVLIRVLGVIVSVILAAILVFNSVLIVKSLIHKDRIPDFAGRRVFIVMTGSMENTIMTGDLIFTDTPDIDTLKEGDIISFFDPDGNGTSVVTHRIVRVTEQDGEKVFVTKGDANNAEDQKAVLASDVVGIYSFRLPGLGNICMFMQSTPGLIVCAVLPMALFIGIGMLISRKRSMMKERETEDLKAELERLRKEKAEIDKSIEQRKH